MQYEQLIQPALWALTIGVAITCLALGIRARRMQEAARTRVRSWFLRATIAGLAAAVFVPAIGVVPAGHRGVVYSWGGGVSPNERGEGVTLLVPWVQHLRYLSVRTQKVYSEEIFSQSSDLQEITVVASANFHVQPESAAELYQEVGTRYVETVIQPALFQRTKAAVGQVKAEDFALSRADLAVTVETELTQQLAVHGIVVEFVNIEDAIFDPAFVQAVKEKVIAEQEAAEQERLIVAEAAKKQQAIIQAEGRARSVLVEAGAQADANDLLAASLSTDLLRWRWITTWDGVLPTTLLGGEDATLLIDGRQP